MPVYSALFPSSPQTLDIGILDIFGFEEFQKNEFEQVSQFSFLILWMWIDFTTYDLY